VLPGDIDANLGAPWIPHRDINAFAAQLFHVAASDVPVAHLKKDAVWSLEADYAAKASVAATSEFGTARANGTWLLELALNMKSPTIYDTIDDGDREVKVVNQEATMAAREKQKLIKEQFRSFVFAEPPHCVHRPVQTARRSPVWCGHFPTDRHRRSASFSTPGQKI